MKKIALYTRVSTEDQHNLNQIVALKSFAEERQLDYDIYSDVESTKNTRPTKQILLNKLRVGVKYDAIVVVSFDRWARNTIELLNDISELNKLGINFISVNDGIDIQSIGEEAIKLVSAIYKCELSRISERTKLGLERAKLQGKKLGRPKGSKDKNQRSSLAYLVKEAKKRRDADELKGRHKGLSYYFDKSKFTDFDELDIIIKSDLRHRIAKGRKNGKGNQTALGI